MDYLDNAVYSVLSYTDWKNGHQIKKDAHRTILSENKRFLRFLINALDYPGYGEVSITLRNLREQGLVESRDCRDRDGNYREFRKVVGRSRPRERESEKLSFLELIPNLPLTGIDWVIVGGESGPGCREMNADWVRQIRDRCVLRNVPFFFKQWGGVRKKTYGRSLDGRTWDQLPSPKSRPIPRTPFSHESRKNILEPILL